MPSVSCPACGTIQEAGTGVGGFHCKACQRDVWLLKCRRCSQILKFHGSATGAGNLFFRCPKCKTKNTWAKQALRSIIAEARRVDRANAVAFRRAEIAAKAEAASRQQSHQQLAGHKNAELQARVAELQNVLSTSLARHQPFGFARMKRQVATPSFALGTLAVAEPAPALGSFMPQPLRGLTAHLSGAQKRYNEAEGNAKAQFEEASRQYQERETTRLASLAKAKAEFDQQAAELAAATNAQHAEVDELEKRYQAGDPDAVTEYFEAVLSALEYPFERARNDRVAFSQASKQLVIELELPDIAAVPAAREYRYVKTRDETAEVQMPASQRRALYTSVIAQMTLRALHEVFAADAAKVAESVVLNGHVDTVDPRTGQRVHPCLVTVRTTRDIFETLNLESVEPGACLKGLNASISRSPEEMAPIKPVLEFDMADPRFIQESDVLSTLDSRPNLMELTPSEFESLITNLFEKMGLETRLTQASRDGGVDCVAYDSRPILGGKVVIQAKRYKNTVGVSAVRDLFGTMQNEGATKGILVATSGYGAASFEFANGKPLELIDGANLLYLLHEHAGIEAKIEVPDDWVDPALD